MSFQASGGRNADRERETELAVIDAAVTGASSASVGDAELTQFALMLRGAGDLPSDEFRERLDAAVLARLAAVESVQPGQLARLREKFGAGRMLATGFAGALASAVIAVAAIPSATIDTAKRAAVTPATATDSKDAVMQLSLPQNAVQTGSAEGIVTDRKVRSRKVEQDVSLVLATAPAGVQGVADRVVAVTDRYRGFVQDSSVSTGDAGPGSAHFILVIPTTRLQAALSDLSKLANVRSRTQNTRDVTGTVNRTNERLANARRDRDRIARQLAGATGADAAELRRRLSLANRRVRQLRGAQERYRGRINYTNIDLTIQGDGETVSTEKGKFGRSVERAWGALVAIAGAALIVGAVSAPFSILLLAGWFALKRGRNRSIRRTIEDRSGTQEPL